jgi:hypothetical protein
LDHSPGALQLLAEERARRDIELTVQQMDATLTAVAAGFGGKGSLAPYREHRRHLLALLEETKPAKKNRNALAR